MSKLTAPQKLIQLLVAEYTEQDSGFRETIYDPDPDALMAKWAEISEDRTGLLQDIKSEFREGAMRTDLSYEGPIGRVVYYYECYEVAAKMLDGSYVGWTYWYGGGKHAEPGAIDWIEYAYDVDFVEVEETRIVKKFSRL